MQHSRKVRRLIPLLALIIALLSGCSERADYTILHISNSPDEYISALTRALPDFTPSEKKATLLTHLNGGGAAEVFDAQALPALKYNAAAHWYPHYSATVVIAVDRDRTDAQVHGWGDLAASGEVVSLNERTADIRLKTAAICYALEGENFTLSKAAALLKALHNNGCLDIGSDDAPVRICFDYEVAADIRLGKNIEVIIPEEGTLAYDVGLLSRYLLDFAEDADVKINVNLDLESDLIHKLHDYEHLNGVIENFSKTLRRQVLGVRLYSSADGREHQLFAIVFIVTVILWINSVTRRITQKGTRAAVMTAGFILVAWTLVRVLKYNLETVTALDRYCWYMYYLFMLAFPIVIVWMVWAADKPDSAMYPPLWWKSLIGLHGVLFTLVMTNDIHRLVFDFDLAAGTWSREYTYGIVYLMICASTGILTLGATISLAVKSRTVPRKGGFLLPAALMITIVLYGIGYAARIPVAWESDLAIVVGMFIMLFIETLIRTGLIPVNTHYARLFAHSPLNMQITDSGGNLIAASSSSPPVSADYMKSYLTNTGTPVREDDDTLVYADSIRGGAIIWHEDVSSLNKLHRETLESVRRLETANSILAEEEAVKRSLSEAEAGEVLAEQLEREVKEKTALLSEMIRSLPEKDDSDKKKETARIALLLCFIKRRCNLFFREREIPSDGYISADELAVYMDETAMFAGYADVKVICASEVKDEILFRKGALIYDFFYAVLEWAASYETGSAVISQLLRKDDKLIFQILPSLDIRTFDISAGTPLPEAIKKAGGTISVKDLDDAIGITLSFDAREGGDGGA